METDNYFVASTFDNIRKCNPGVDRIIEIIKSKILTWLHKKSKHNTNERRYLKD